MQEMDRRVALLRLMLADITDRERQAAEASKQLRGQLTRIVDFTVQRNGGVANALSAMAEVEERLAQQETVLRHLQMLRKRARSELEALVVTRGVADARARLAELEAQRAALLEGTDAQATSEAPAGEDAATQTAEEVTEATQPPHAPTGTGEPAAPPAPTAREPGALTLIDAEIAELRAAIQAASEAAARALTEDRGEEQAHPEPRPRER